MSLISINPATGQRIHIYGSHTSRQIEAVLKQAHLAFLGWRELSPALRARHLRALAKSLRSQLDDLADLITAEVGKPITQSRAEDIVYSNLFTGVHGNYLKPSIVAAGLDPANLAVSDASKMSFGTDASGERIRPKAWKDIWGSGQGIGSVGAVMPAAELIARFRREYDDARDPAL